MNNVGAVHMKYENRNSNRISSFNNDVEEEFEIHSISGNEIV